MQKKLIIPVVAFVYLLTIVSSASAQNSMAVISRATVKSLEATVKAPVDINSRAMRDFKKMYPHVQGEEWQAIKGGWIARFIENDITSRVVFNQRGDWYYTISYYHEKNLPSEVRAQVKRTYYDYSITGIQEIHVEDKIIYLVHMQDEKTWKMVRVCAGEMEVLEDFKKA